MNSFCGAISIYWKSLRDMMKMISPMRARILPSNIGPMVKRPRMPPMTASPQAFRLIATIPPAKVKIDSIAPMMPQVVRNDWSCSAVMGDSGGSTFCIIEMSNASADAQVSKPRSPAMIKKIPPISGLELGCFSGWG